MDPIEAAIEEIKSLPHDQSFTFSEIARKHGVVRSTLIRRYKAITEPRTVKAVKQHALTPDQEIELVAWINRQNEKCLPPLRRLVQNWASEIAGKPIGESWVGGFLDRHRDELIAKWTKGMDRDRHQADSWHKYKRYFDFWHAK
ncbi:hypothetical protein CC86DRAFT_242280, partial [Ophiobolus disseminans]